MILGVIVFSILFITFIILGTLLLTQKGYWFISGYRSLSQDGKQEFVTKNNLKKIFSFYAYYCYAVAGILLLALIGATLDLMIIIFISYLLFGAGTIAVLIFVNFSSTYKVIPVEKKDAVVLENTEEKTPNVVEVIKQKKMSEKEDKK